MLLFPAWLTDGQWRQHLTHDVVAGLIVGVVVIPQSLGYALLAGLPPVYGLYAAIVPVLVYAFIGSSNTQAIGPVAITSMMTAQALAPFAASHSASYIALAALMALLVGVFLLLAALLRLGWIMQFISRGVMAAFITGAALLIIISQVKYMLGVSVQGDTLPQLLHGFWQQQSAINFYSVVLGLSAMIVLAVNRHLGQVFVNLRFARLLTKLMPIVVLMIASIIVYCQQLATNGVQVVGYIAAGLPSFTLVQWPNAGSQWQALSSSALLIALIAFISSASMAKSVALQRQQPFDANRELLGLGLANISAAFFKGLPITGGFSRTAVNIEAGAKTPLAGVVSALVIAGILVVASAWFYYLPLAVLGAGVMIAVSALVDFQTLKIAWQSDQSEAWAYIVTLLGVLMAGLQLGLLVGLLVSLAALIWRSHQPHVAIVGQVGESSHFLNVERHAVTTWPSIVLMRIDESLFFGNSDSIASRVWQEVNAQPQVKHVVLILSAVNHIDLSSQWMLQSLAQQLSARHIQLHAAEIKGFVMDSLRHTPLIKTWRGQIFLTTEQAVNCLKPAQKEPEYHL